VKVDTDARQGDDRRCEEARDGSRRSLRHRAGDEVLELRRRQGGQVPTQKPSPGERDDDLRREPGHVEEVGERVCVCPSVSLCL
jgi:hypothetical protein